MTRSRVESALPLADSAGTGAQPAPAHPVLALQQTIGNRATTQMVQRGGPGDALEGLRVGQAMRFAAASDEERLAAIREELDATIVDEGLIEAAWRSFGDRVPEIAAKHAKLWNDSLEEGADVADLPAFKKLRDQFAQDVKATVKRYLAANRTLVDAERKRLGLARPGGEEPSRIAEITQDAATDELQQLAAQAAEIVTAEQGLRSLVVGAEYRAPHNLYYDGTWIDVTFDPRQKPPEPPLAADARTWDEVKAQWDAMEDARLAIGSQSPGLFALMEHGGASVHEVATGSPAAARSAVSTALDTVVAKMAETEAAIDGDDLDWRELGVVHQQLYAGRTGPSGVAWSDTVPKGVARDVIEDYEDDEWWLAIGLGTLAAAAFVFSELATGGLATILWASAGVGIGVGQAAMSWEKVDDLATAEAATASPGTELVTKDQVRAATIAAVVDSVFAFLDAAGAAKTFARGGARLVGEVGAYATGRAAAGARAAAIEAIDGLEPAARTAAIEESVREVGAVDAIRRSGKSADELADLVGRDSDTGRRLLAHATAPQATGFLGFMERAAHAFRTHGEAEAAVKQLATMDREAAEAAVANAVDVLGPARTVEVAGGWKRLVERLGNDSTAGRRLAEWRDGLADDLLEEFGEESVIRTGSKGRFSNDLDVSTLGENAARDRERVRSWLAARVGRSPDALHDLLQFDVFTDPRRMHLADLRELGLDATLRERLSQQQAARQEQLVMTRRLYDARQAGDDATVQALEQEMHALGITEIRDFRPLTGGERERLGAHIDALHADLVNAAREGDHLRIPGLVDEIADRQALLNASEGGGYFTGGGVRRYVSEREGLPGFERPEPAAMGSGGATKPAPGGGGPTPPEPPLVGPPASAAPLSKAQKQVLKRLDVLDERFEATLRHYPLAEEVLDEFGAIRGLVARGDLEEAAARTAALEKRLRRANAEVVDAAKEAPPPGADEALGDLSVTRGRTRLPQVEGLRVRPPLDEGPELSATRFRAWEEGFRLDGNLAEYDRVMALASRNPQRAGRDFQRLVAGDLGGIDLQEAFRRPGRRMDIGSAVEVTIEGRNRAFSGKKLDQFWLDLMDTKRVMLVVPKLSDEARRQLARLGAQAEEVLGEEVMLFVREVGAHRAMTPAQLYGAFVDQLPKLDEAAAELRSAIGAAGADDALDSSLKALGKYGERLSESAADLLYGNAPLVTAKEVDALAARCRAFREQVERGGVLTTQGLAEEASQVRLEATKLLGALEELVGTTRTTLREIAEVADVAEDLTPVQDIIRHELLVERLTAIARGELRMLEEQLKLAVHEEAEGSAVVP